MLRTALLVLFLSTGSVVAGGATYSYTAWSQEIVQQAATELPTLRTHEDADWWARLRVAQLYHEAFPPYAVEAGSFRAGPYGITMRDWSGEDFGALDKSFGSMIDLVEDAVLQVGNFPHAETHLRMLRSTRDQIAGLNSPARTYRQEVLNRWNR